MDVENGASSVGERAPAADEEEHDSDSETCN